jgi:hypothetical protein
VPARVLDSNVLAAAQGAATHQDADCMVASIACLEIAARGLVVLDADDSILNAYRTWIDPHGQPGPVELFYRWLIQVKGDRRHCRQVTLDRDATGEFAAYPKDPEFTTFDVDDRVYVATAIASGLRPNIINATDSDWLAVRHALERHRIRLRNLCPI